VKSAVRVVLDTNTVVSALVWGGTPYALIAAATEERLELYSSPTMLEELAEVLGRAKFAPRLQQEQRTVAQLIEQYRGLVEVVSPEPIVPAVSTDPDDDHVLACALPPAPMRSCPAMPTCKRSAPTKTSRSSAQQSACDA
jgi:putative PIN family toxin of toxin-antitoxin system